MWIHGASTLSYVKWHPVESQGTTPSTSFHVRLPQPKFQSRMNLLVSFVVTANALTVWRWYPGKEVCLSHGMLQSVPRWQTPTFRPLHPQLASAAEMAASRKQAKYAALSGSYVFQQIALETLGPINESAVQFLNDLGHRITSVSNDDKEAQFLFQWLSIALQRFNAILLHESFESDVDPDL